MMKHKVFISHSQKDNEIAKKFVVKLNEKDIQSWLDENELIPGESWEEKIKDSLSESDFVIALLGEGDVSPNVLVEMGMAFAQGKRIVPVLLGENSNADIFSNLQQVHTTKEFGIDAAIGEIEQIMDAQDLSV